MVSRRQFLKTGGSLVIYFSIAPGVLTPIKKSMAQGGLTGSLAANPNLDSWLQIKADGTIAVYSGKVEIGQGIQTALGQIIAEELDIKMGRIYMATVDTRHSPDEGTTVGSLSVQRSGSALRAAGAEARAILAGMASKELGTDAADLDIRDGEFYRDGRATGVDYWSLLGDKEFSHTLTGEVEPKPWQQHRIVGTGVQRIDHPAKVFGQPIYVQDMRMEGMLHARVVRSPRLPQARLVRANLDAARSMTGVIDIVRDGSFLAVVAEREEQAIAASKALAATAEWEDDVNLPTDAVEWLRSALSEDIISDQQGTPGQVDSASSHSADYFRPWQAHASMSPSAAVALRNADGLTVWSHSQGIYPLRGAIAGIVGLDEAEVTCIHAQASGCYGHNGADDAGCDAAVIAMHVPGHPVRLQWSRQDEFSSEPYGSAMSMHLEAGLDEGGRIVDWRHDLWSCTHTTRPGGAAGAGHLLAARQVENSVTRPDLRTIPLPSGGMDRNAVPIYAIPNRRVIKHFVKEMPLRVSALRGLGAYANVFAIESFVDELAALSGTDPLAFRLKHLEDERAIELLSRLGENAAWSSPRDKDGVHGRGIGFARYKNLSSWCGVVADVAIDSSTGVVTLQRVTGVVDAGQAINPDGILNQIEGGIVQGASWTLKEQVQHDENGTRTRDWASYPILRFSEVPEVDVEVINRPELPSLGAGESSQGPIAAAIANAVADAVGIRLRDLPFTPEKVREAIMAKAT